MSKPLFETGDLVMLKVDRPKGGTGYWKVTKVRHDTMFGYTTYTVIPYMSHRFYQKILDDRYWRPSDYEFQTSFFAPWGDRWKIEKYVNESELRPYELKDMDIKYVVRVDGEVEIETTDQEVAQGYQADTPYLDISIETIDRNTKQTIETWTNYEQEATA